MIQTCGVHLHGERIGTLTNLDGDYNLLSFEERYLEDPLRPTLSQAFIGVGGPVRRVPRTHTVAPPFFANLLFEKGSALRTLIARQYDISEGRDYPYLAALGANLPGAVSLLPEGTVERSSAPSHDSDRKLDERRVRFSLAGMQVKFSASLVRGRFAVTTTDPSGSEWICKLPTAAFLRLPENEAFVMDLARDVGLDVPETKISPIEHVEGLRRLDLPLGEDEPRLVYSIRRFDRGDDGLRIHVEDLNQAVNQSPHLKYENYSSSEVARIVATLCSPDDVDEFVKRLVFGVCIGNDDMHLKNWALIYTDRRSARLAPMYDYVCTRRYLPAGSLALTIGGVRESTRVDREALSRFSRMASLSERRAFGVAKSVAAAIRDRWPHHRDRAEAIGLRAPLERHFAFAPLARL